MPAFFTSVTLPGNPSTNLHAAPKQYVDTAVAIDPPTALTDGPTINTDCSLSSHFYVTVAGDRTLANPTNAFDGQKIVWEITASGANRTITLGSNFAFGSDITGITSVISAKTDYIGAVYNSRAGKFHVIAYVKGY